LRVQQEHLLDAFLVAGGQGLAVQVDAVADPADADPFSIAEQSADFADHLARVLLAHHHRVAEAKGCALPHQQAGPPLADSGEQKLVAAAHLLDVGDLGVADRHALHVRHGQGLLLTDSQVDGPAVGLGERSGRRERKEDGSDAAVRLSGHGSWLPVARSRRR